MVCLVFFKFLFITFRLNELSVLTMKKSLVNEKVLAGKENVQEKVLQHKISKKIDR